MEFDEFVVIKCYVSVNYENILWINTISNMKT